jgi:nucleoid DNA-binding protein
MIKKYIVELLKENTRVIIPDLGAFMAKVKAKAPKDSKELKDKDISFNDFLKYNDGLLVNHIIKEEKVNKEEALKKIKDFVNETDKAVRKGEKIPFDEMGSLYIDDRGSLKYTEGDAPKATAKKEQKPKIEPKEEPKVEVKKETAKKVEPKKPEPKKEAPKKEITKKEEPKKKEEKPVEAKKDEPKKEEKVEASVGKQVLKTVQKGTEVKKEEPKKEEPKKEEPKKEEKKEPIKKTVTPQKTTSKAQNNDKLIIIWTSVGIVAVAAAVLIWLNFSTIKSWIMPDKPEVVEKVKEPVVEPVVDTVKTEPVKKKEPEPEPVKVIPKNYHVVAGCFKIESNASNYEVALKKEGYDAKYIGEWNGFYTVVYASFENKAEALKELNDISKNKGKPGWILHYQL